MVFYSSSNNFKPLVKMPRRSTSAISFYDQGKFVVNGEDYCKPERSMNFGESCLSYSNKFGLVLIASGVKLLVVRHSELEAKFDGGDEEQQLEIESILASHEFDSVITMIKLSYDELYLSIATDDHVDVFHIAHLASKVN